MSDAALTQLAESLSGEFDNQLQSLADPAWYLRLRVWNRPLPGHIFTEGYGFFIEQVSVAAGQPPYRQRILHLTRKPNGLWGQYYGLVDPLAFRGSATQPERLGALTQADLVTLPTCGLAIDLEPATQRFSARLPADTLCSITYEGKPSYIYLGFDIGPEAAQPASPMELRVYDHGVDGATGAKTWGPQMGPFRLIKQAAFSFI